RDVFCRTLISELAGTLQDVIGLKESEGFISIVGKNIGEWINDCYKTQLKQDKLTREQVIDVLIDLKARINGDFKLLEQDQDKAVFKNSQCPFEDKVIDRQCMCMMTSNVFGSITANNLGYSKVVLEETIARGDKECKVVVHFNRTAEAEAVNGREYFNLED
ncbi:MAG: transcriptional regulator, partial [Methylococcales bacterium]|nr:transcriptional regulator [Methylococcales bacterium]